MHVLVTGGAGFVGSHLVDSLLEQGHQVTALDNFDPFYARVRKEQNIARHRTAPGYALVEADICDLDQLRACVPRDVDVIAHLAAKAGVRPSIAHPLAYQDVNVRGTHHLLEVARERGIEQFVFASSSSVYGVNPRVPWREDDSVLAPISPYASTKVSGELLGHVYSHLYGIRFLALRFFTVYGPRQRPDMAIHKFARLLDEIVSPDVFTAAKTLREINAFTRDDGTPLNYALVNLKDWCKNTFEVVNQLRINTDNSHHRYDVILLINGIPAAQIELKALGINPRRAIEKAVKGLVTGRYEWVGFTSVNAVRAIKEKFQEWGLDARAFAGLKVAAVGDIDAAGGQFAAPQFRR